MTRTDIHRPSAPEFDPENYDLWDVYDLESEWDRRTRMEEVNRLREQGKRFAGHQHNGQCGHCGSYLRYAALMIHEPTNTMIYVGQQCLGNRFESLTKDQFDKLRKTASLHKDRMRRAERISKLVDAEPYFAELTYLGNGGLVDTSDFLMSVGESFMRNGELTDRQWESVSVALRRQVERLAEWATRDAQRAEDALQADPAPVGRVQLTGEILSTKFVDSEYGGSLKMLVRADEGYRVWATVPKALLPVVSFDTMDALKGKRVTMLITLTPSDDDPKFAFGKRPSKAEFAK